MRFDQLAEITKGMLRTTEQAERVFAGVSIDSRTLQPEQLFIAIRGESADGHGFVDRAVASGAAGVLAQTGCLTKTSQPREVPVVEVPDSHAAMLQLAASYRDTVDAQRLGITGSNGKTTTKEFACRMLQAVTDNVYCSPGNYNNLYGIPLALFAMPTTTDIAVLEMGISVPGEMARLASLVRPHLLIITNVGATHLEFLGSVENVAREKLSALEQAQPNAPLIINADDPILMAAAKQISSPQVTFGLKSDATFSPDRVDSDRSGMTSVTIEGHTFRLQLFGDHQIMNLLAAYAAVRELGYTFDAVDTDGIELLSADMRGERIEADGITFVSDCYNANPESVRSGLASFNSLPGSERRVIILGDMLELGEDSERYHIEIGEQINEYTFDMLIVVGALSRNIAKGARGSGVACRRLMHYDTAEACANDMVKVLQSGDLVYLKGSRGIGLEKILNRIVKQRGTA